MAVPEALGPYKGLRVNFTDPSGLPNLSLLRPGEGAELLQSPAVSGGHTRARPQGSVGFLESRWRGWSLAGSEACGLGPVQCCIRWGLMRSAKVRTQLHGGSEWSVKLDFSWTVMPSRVCLSVLLSHTPLGTFCGQRMCEYPSGEQTLERG